MTAFSENDPHPAYTHTDLHEETVKWGTVPQADCTDIGKALLYTGIWWHCVSCSHSRTERL